MLLPYLILLPQTAGCTRPSTSVFLSLSLCSSTTTTRSLAAPKREKITVRIDLPCLRAGVPSPGACLCRWTGADQSSSGDTLGLAGKQDGRTACSSSRRVEYRRTVADKREAERQWQGTQTRLARRC